MAGKRNTLKVNTYRVLSECVERGVLYGFRRAHKQYIKPSEEVFREAIENAVMNEVSEHFTFDE